MEVMNAGMDRPLGLLRSRSMNAARCCRNLQSPVANEPRTARAISFLISTGILIPSCPCDNGPFVLPKEHFVMDCDEAWEGNRPKTHPTTSVA